MKKSIFAAIILFSIMFLLIYVIHNAKIQKENLTLLNNNIEKVKLINKDFDLYLKNTLEYNNFDLIESAIDNFSFNLNQIYNNNIFNQQFSDEIIKLKQNTQIKIKKVRKAKSYRAILNNSLRIIQNLKRKILIQDFDYIYVNILTLDINPEIKIEDIYLNLKELKSNTKYEKYFLIHAKNILQYKEKLNKLKKTINELDLDNKLDNIHSQYKEFTNKAVQKAHLSIGILFTLLFLLIITYLIYAFKLIKSNNNLSRFKKTVENSDNIVVITDKNQNITYVNEEFTKTTGYTPKEVIGKKPNILKSGHQSKEFYEDLNKTINSGKKWSGEFINIDKNGDLSFEKASITPVLDNNGEIKEFIAIKLDITNETIKSQQLKEKEKLLAQQSKMAAMGEMLENIAHQWRQPLSKISTIATGIATQKEYGISDNKDEIKKLYDINESVQYLSETIDDFRDFFEPNKKKNLFNLENSYKRALKISSSKFKTLNINVIENLKDIKLNGLENEIIQVIMNILNNARDVLETKKNQKKLIFVNIYTDNQNAILEIKDNGGGVPIDVIDKIFDPYFTTKHKSQGTGIGLYMSYEMVTKHMNGKLLVKNVEYIYENINYTGACFTITLPLD